MPGKEELFSKLLFLIQSPAQRLATVINAAGRDLAVVINQGVEKGKFAGAAVARLPKSLRIKQLQQKLQRLKQLQPKLQRLTVPAVKRRLRKRRRQRAHKEFGFVPLGALGGLLSGHPPRATETRRRWGGRGGMGLRDGDANVATKFLNRNILGERKWRTFSSWKIRS